MIFNPSIHGGASPQKKSLPTGPRHSAQIKSMGNISLFIFSLNTLEEGDFLGLIYQSICSEGNKSNSGSYYTPSDIIRESLKQTGFSGSSFLDPCCGTGNYLLYAAELLRLPPEQIYGFDSDDIATRIARVNLLLAFPSYDSTPNIRCLNTLTDLATGEFFCDTNHLLGRVDFIATNPPWGAFKNSAIAAPHSLGLKSNEAFALFLVKSLTLLREGGLLSFVLPESILKIRTHSEIRHLILKGAKIVRISRLGSQFSGVFTAAIRLDLIKGEATPDWLVSIESDGESYRVEQARFMSNAHYSFDMNVNEHADRVIKKLYAIDHTTLAGKLPASIVGFLTAIYALFPKPDPIPSIDLAQQGADGSPAPPDGIST